MIHKLSEALRQRVEVKVRDHEGNVLSGVEPGDGKKPKLPGGGIEEGETAREAAEREVAEETGYKITKIEPSNAPDTVTDEARTQWLEARATQETTDPRKGDDGDDFRMVGFRPEAEVEKTAQEGAPVVSYVPRQSLESVLKHGLVGNKVLAENEELLNTVAQAKGVDPDELRAAIEKTRSSYKKDVHEGPNVMFSPVPDDVELAEAHPLRQGAYAQVQVDLDALMRDQPETKAFGIELDPEGRGDTRRRFLTPEELQDFRGKTPQELWQNYDDPDNEGYYAANVPHASIHTPTGSIDPKYLKVAMTRAEQKEKDLELWREYNRNPSKQTLKPLMKALDPVIQVEVNKWSGAIARPVLEAKAKSLALEAIKSYNPHAGAALATHVTNRLKKLSRKVYTHQDAVRIPEYKKLKVQNLHKANQKLMDIHGREPTNQELTDHLAWSPKTLSKVQQAQHAELIQSEDMGAGMFEHESVWGSDSGDGMVDMLYYDMPPEDKLIFEHSTGYSGKPILSNKELRKKTGLTQGQLSYRKRKLVDMFQDQMV